MPQIDTGGSGGFNLDAEQLRNAAIIYQVGQSMGLGIRDIQIGLITAMVESGLRNVHYGDRDSLGLFQQRPSQGWGSPEQVMDPQYAAHKFFSALKGLGPSRLHMSMGEAAQAVQRSAYPDRYGAQVGLIRQVFPDIQKAAGSQPLSMDGGSYQAPTIPGQPLEFTGLPTADTSVGSPVQLGAYANPMLAAWGMDSATTDPLMSGVGTFLSQGTNQLLQQLKGLSGNYQKGVDGWRAAVLAAARGALGTPYEWGGTSLQNGVDCSGLVQSAFAQAGINLPRISYQQANSGSRVGYGGLQPGDLIAWDNSSRNNGADHIAIYLGNGQIIEAPRPGLSVRIRSIGKNLDGGYGVHLSF